MAQLARQLAIGVLHLARCFAGSYLPGEGGGRHPPAVFPRDGSSGEALILNGYLDFLLQRSSPFGKGERHPAISFEMGVVRRH